MKPNIVTQIAIAALWFVMAYLFWSAYRNPAKNRVTRFLYSYVDATRFTLLSPNAAMLAMAMLILAVGIGTLIAIVASAVK